jgi:16S rRNA (uracil1498-N3)-methyltransferase
VAAHVFVPSLPEAPTDPVLLAPDDRHHLARVLRLRPGETVTVSDGAGGLVPCTWTGTADDDPDGAPALAPAGPVTRAPAPVPVVTIALALTKGDRPEWAVQKLTEVGVDRIVLFAADRSVVRWDADKVDRNLTRLARVAREAAMQSRRVWLPSVSWSTFPELLALPPFPLPALAVPDGSPPSLEHPTVLVGPEGGWSDDELAAAADAGNDTVGLGPTVLRAETAAVVAGSFLTGLRARIIGPRATDTL